MTTLDERPREVRAGGDPDGPSSSSLGAGAESGAAGAAQFSEAPDRPRLAPSTWLVGHLQESALEEPPWAVERAGRGYIEMGEVAYRIAEQADGEQTVEEIAAAVSAVLGRTVSPGDVAAFVSTVLIPRGVLSPPDDQGYLADVDAEPALEPQAHGRRGHRSGARPGRRAARERVIGPAPLERVASILMWLFWPPVMVTIVGASVGALFWLYGSHGLAQGVVQVLRLPVLVVPMLILMAIGLVMPSIGPMVALYSGGARIERLRIAPSLVHPRIAVDVADDYGLSRWTRLLVNLSGIYLDLVFTLILCAVATLTGGQFLLLVAALVTLNMLRLLVPFGRPGADRLLADLLLVREPLRYADRALGRWGLGGPAPSTLPPMKRWGHVAIWAYLGAVGALLLIVGVAALWSTPIVVTTVLAALCAHVTAIPAAVGERHVLGALGGLLQSAVLVLAVFGLAVLTIVLARELVVRAWAWTRASRQRRMAGAVSAILTVALLVLFWAPVIVTGTPGTSEGRSVRSLAGVAFRPLSSISRGTLFDLFSNPPEA